MALRTAITSSIFWYLSLRWKKIMILAVFLFGIAKFMTYEDVIQKKTTTKVSPTKILSTLETHIKTRKLPAMPPVDPAIEKGYGRIKDECMGYFTASRMQRTVDTEVINIDNLLNYDDITFVTQMTSSRYEKLYRISIRWSGPISVAVYVDKSTDALSFKKQMRSLLGRHKNIALHIVKEEGNIYPVNFLRNVALENAETRYIFLCDIDLEPMPRLDSHLRNYISKGYLQGKTALVVPAFEALYANFTFPENKAEVINMWKTKKTIKPSYFRIKDKTEIATWPQGPTSYYQWVNASKPYYANWNNFYEPFVVVEKAGAPKYWPNFAIRYHDKASHLTELFAMGFNFVVLPDVFTVHTPHKRLQKKNLHFRCAQRENTIFMIHLMQTYGWKLPMGLER